MVRKDQLPYWRTLYNWVVCHKILIRESLFNVRKLGIKSHRQNSSEGTWHTIRSIAINNATSANLKNAIRALLDLRKGHKAKPCNKKDGTWREESTSSKNTDKATSHLMLAPSSKKPEERDFAVDSARIPTERCKQTRKHKYTFTTLISS